MRDTTNCDLFIFVLTDNLGNIIRTDSLFLLLPPHASESRDNGIRVVIAIKLQDASLPAPNAIISVATVMAPIK
jgi:hypothetical protein